MPAADAAGLEAPGHGSPGLEAPSPETPSPETHGPETHAPETRAVLLGREIAAALRPDAPPPDPRPAPAAERGELPMPPEGAATEPSLVQRAVIRSTAESMLRGATPDRLDIALETRELGAIRFAVSIEDGALHLACTADRAETLDFLRRHAAILAAELRGDGLEAASFSFGGERGERRDRPGMSASGFEAADAAPPARPATDTGRTLDLRL